MKKQSLIAFIAHFEKELAALIQSAKTAHSAATHEESRAEDRHDTFAIEASYLAAGQAERVQDIRNTLNELNGYLSTAQSTGQASIPQSVAPGTLITLDLDGKLSYSLICKTGGGTSISVEGKIVSIVSPASPLGDHLLGLVKRDSFILETKTTENEYIVAEIS